MSDKLISKIPEGPLEQKWTKRKSEIHLVSPNNKRKLEIIVVGTGLGGASAAASAPAAHYYAVCAVYNDKRGYGIEKHGFVGLSGEKTDYIICPQGHYIRACGGEYDA